MIAALLAVLLCGVGGGHADPDTTQRAAMLFFNGKHTGGVPVDVTLARLAATGEPTTITTGGFAGWAAGKLGAEAHLLPHQRHMLERYARMKAEAAWRRTRDGPPLVAAGLIGWRVHRRDGRAVRRWPDVRDYLPGEAVLDLYVVPDHPTLHFVWPAPYVGYTIEIDVRDDHRDDRDREQRESDAGGPLPFEKGRGIKVTLEVLALEPRLFAVHGFFDAAEADAFVNASLAINPENENAFRRSTTGLSRDTRQVNRRRGYKQFVRSRRFVAAVVLGGLRRAHPGPSPSRTGREPATRPRRPRCRSRVAHYPNINFSFKPFQQPRARGRLQPRARTGGRVGTRCG